MPELSTAGELRPDTVKLEELVDVAVLQSIQDAFAAATGVASLITDPDGRPITKPSRFCRLCSDVIRGTAKGLANCMRSDVAIGAPNPGGPIVQPCLSGGLWDGGASITVGDRHIGSWLIGQVVEEAGDREKLLAYAREIGADEEAFRAALAEVTVMPRWRFEQVCQALFLVAKQISTLAYQKMLLEREIEARKAVEADWREANDELSAANEEITAANEEITATEEELRQQFEYLQDRERQLAESERRFREMLEYAQLVAVITDSEGRVTFCNDSLLDATGWRREEVLDQDWHARFIPEEVRDEEIAASRRFLASGPESARYAHYINDIQTKGGERRTISWNITRLCDAEGATVALARIGEDITERLRAEADLYRTNRRIQHIFESISDAFFALDAESRFTYLNSRAEQILRRPQAELLGKSVWDVWPNAIGSTFEPGVRRALAEHTPVTLDFHYKWADAWFEIHIYPAQDGMLSVYFQDITVRKRGEEKSRFLAYHDQLTKLPNRLLFHERMVQAMSRARRESSHLALLFVDLDNFKTINDTLGHDVGDELLRAVANRLAGLIRCEDTIARMGGDEFTILLTCLKASEGAAQMASRVNESFHSPFVLRDREFHVTASVGIALYPTDGDDATTLLRNADTAMYKAKESGRSRYEFFTPSMNEKLKKRLALDSSLRRALAKDEFELFYQPVMDIATRRVLALEALLRWHHPERGYVPPDEFIPHAEDMGLMVRIGAWVLRTACAQVKAWQEAGLPAVRVFANISASELRQPDFVDTVVGGALHGAGLDSSLLGLEITESVSMQDSIATAETLHRLRKMGVQIALDDFGTGYSALSYLRQLPIDIVKLDKSFVSDVANDAGASAVATAVVDLAHHLNLKVVAEGVEVWRQLDFFRRQGCDAVQGFLYCPPLPSAEIEAVLRDRLGVPADK